MENNEVLNEFDIKVEKVKKLEASGEKAYKAKLLERNLETAISEEVFETLKERIHDGGQ